MAMLHAGNQHQKEQLLTADHWLCMERAKCYTDVYRETEGEDPSTRAAKALVRTFERMSINISPWELLVGNRSSRDIAPPFAPEKGDFTFIFNYQLPELQKFGYFISPQDKRVLLQDIIPYWRGKTVRDEKVEKFTEHGLNSQLNFSLIGLSRIGKAFGISTLARLLIDTSGTSRIKQASQFLRLLAHLPRNLRGLKAGTQDNIIGRCRCIDTQAHIVIGHKNVLQLGFRGIADKAKTRLADASTDEERYFLESVILVAQGMKDFSARFATLARKKADEEQDEGRKQELLEIAGICDSVPWNPPHTFHEALQSMWFTQNAAIISYGAGSGITPGRVDQLLYPYYEKDLAEGTITRDKALQLLEEFIIKINNNVVIWPNIAGVRLNHLGSDIENITIGGLGRDGEDATNELSYLFMEAIMNTRLATTASFRISEKSPSEFLRKVIEMHARTNGPAMFNDEIVIQALVNDGYSVEDARDYCLVGCVEPSGNGNTFGATGGTKIYLPTVLDLVFNRGKTTFFGNVDTFDSGDPASFQSFEEFNDAFTKQMQFLVSSVARATNMRDAIWANKFHNPLISCTIDGCIDSGKDMTEGGASYNFGAIGAGGLGTTVDSLAAIKKYIYDDKSIGMKELISALATNFKSREPLRRRLSKGPKFGNNDDQVDAIAVRLVDQFCEMCAREPTINDGHYKASFISYGLNVYEGALEPATPDGRKAGAPVSNSISPSNGAEMKGPTAVLNSLAKIDHAKIGYGDSLNMKFPAYLLHSEKGSESLEQLDLTYFKKGGFHVQFNIIDASTLKEAQLHPENYDDLIVRVSGYSAYFTRLGKEIQDDLIARVEFGNF